MTLDQLVTQIRQNRETALLLARNAAEDQYRYGWQCRALECLDILRDVPGTPEYEDERAEAARRGIEL